LLDTTIARETPVKNLRAKILTGHNTNPNWFPKINDFSAIFDPIFQLSSVKIEADYGLTYYGKLHPFKDFDIQSPSWWEPYTKVKHEIFRQIEKKATARAHEWSLILFGLFSFREGFSWLS